LEVLFEERYPTGPIIQSDMGQFLELCIVYSVYWMASTEAAHVMTESWMFESTLRTMDPPLTCSLDIDHERIEHRYKLSLG
jgi:hypothetical protein